MLPATAAQASARRDAAKEGAGKVRRRHAGVVRSRRCSSGVEQLTCNQQVVGSTPTIGFARRSSNVRRGTRVAKGSRL